MYTSIVPYLIPPFSLTPSLTLRPPLYINYQAANYYLLDWRARQAIFASGIHITRSMFRVHTPNGSVVALWVRRVLDA